MYNEYIINTYIFNNIVLNINKNNPEENYYSMQNFHKLQVNKAIFIISIYYTEKRKFRFKILNYRQLKLQKRVLSLYVCCYLWKILINTSNFNENVCLTSIYSLSL